jgi:hypothetical protein
MKKILGLILLLPNLLWSQNGVIRGQVTNALNNEPLPFANVVIKELQVGATTDLDGKYEIKGIKAGLYNVTASFVGFQSKTEFEVQVTNNRPVALNFRLQEESQNLGEVTVNAQTRLEKRTESPVSLQTIGINEIQRNPGGNQDISRVIQSLPGVASSVAFRNDLIIRGGGPNENRFFLDGIEIPAINHFATQGSSGGPVGMINVNFIREVDFYTGAFPAERGNALSSIMEIKLKDGREDRVGGRFQVGASEIGLTLDGPLGNKGNFLVSARRSYLQFLFAALELPFLPTYNDFQFRVKYNFNQKNQITILGLGAIDQFKLNLKANETEAQRYILNFLPVNEQWNYSIGAKYTHFGKNNYTNVILSRYMLNNRAEKFQDNDPDGFQILDYNSYEIENKFRLEHVIQQNGWRTMLGGGLEQAKYETIDRNYAVPVGQPPINYETFLQIYKYYAFGQVSKSIFREKLELSAGFRADGNDFNANMANPLNQFSPRISLSYNITSELSFNTNWGIFYQLPPYTALGFRNPAGDLVNQDLKFIQANHYVAGFSYFLPFNAKVSVEGFLKDYSQYPFMLNDSISLANLGGDFGVIGNAPAVPTSSGRSYGLEVTYQQKLYKGFFGIAALTLVRSEFQDKNDLYVPSSWDNRIIATLTAGKKFGKNWEAGFQYQYLGGAPFTPFDVEATVLIPNWDNIGRGIPDNSLLNTQRLAGFNRLNVRVDKRWYFEKWSLDVFIDIQNLLGQSVEGQPFIDVERDAAGQPIPDPNNPGSYIPVFLPNSQGTVLPSLGLIIDF